MASKFWTAEEDEKLHQLCKQGLYYSRIAEILGRTKCSCLGRAKRKGYAELAPRKPVWNAGLSKGLSGKGVKVEEMAEKAEKIERMFCETVAEDYDGFQSITFEALGPGNCRWPRGEARDMVFCGERTLPGSSWCPHHRSIAYVPYSSSRSIARLMK